ncbi:MAG: hypothetical protein RR505_09550 [Raoultibacter sp.]
MKRFTVLFTLLFLFPALAFADDYYSMAQLRQQAGIAWEKSYTAHNRRIDMDVEIHLPEAEQVPVLRIAPREPAVISQQLMDGVDEFENTVGRMYIVKKPDPMAVPSQDIGSRIAYHRVAELDDGAVYAKNNTLTWGEAKAEAKRQFDQWGLSQTHFDLEHPSDCHTNQGYALVTDELWDEKQNQAYGERGYYLICAQQLLHGVPLWTDIRETFRHYRLEPILNLGRATFALDQLSGGYNLFAAAVDEIGMLAEDIPLCSFEKVRSAYEAKIASGNIRQADQLTFAYMVFRGDDKTDYIAFPCWILRCLYKSNPKDAVKVPDGLTWLQTDQVLDLVVNAQTGELIEPYDKSRERDQLPQWFSWQEVR